MASYLGVDGGGTKTHFVLIDDAGFVLAEATGPTCYVFGGETDRVERVLGDGFARITALAGADPVDHVFVGLPGYGESSADLAALDAVPGRVLGHDRYTCGNDMVAGWAGSLGGDDGVNVVAGTGSIAYGEWRGASARAGGWSEIVGDEGSGYWTAVQGLNAFSRMADGRLPRGPLHGAMRQAVGAATDLDVIGVVAGEWASDRTRIAALSRVVTAVADADPVARAIVARAGEELAAIAAAVRTAIDAGRERLPLSYSGGMFADAGVRAAFSAAAGEGWDLREPRFGPGVGAALVARRIARAHRSRCADALIVR